MNTLKNFKMNDALSAMRGVAEALKRMSISVPMKSDKIEDRKKKKKTQKGAVHQINPVFKPGRTLVAPSLYRRSHMGVVKIIPNYKKSHPAPKGRNLVKGVSNG